MFRALVAFGAPLKTHGFQVDDLARPGSIYQLGLPPLRIDLLTAIDGIAYEGAAAGFVLGRLGGESVQFIGLEDQIKNKRASGRLRDLADAEAHEAIQKSREG